MKRFCLFLLLPILLCACGSTQTLSDTNLFAMDTVITLRLPENTPADIISAASARITGLERLLSRTDPQSEICRFNTGAEDTMTVSDDTAAVLRCALEAAAATDGAYDPTTTPLTVCWDITSETPSVPSEETIAEARTRVSYTRLSLDGQTLVRSQQTTQLDLGGCAKGYACGETVELLRASGVTWGIVSFGGNIGILGQKPDRTPWRIAIRNPADPTSNAGYLSLTDGYVSVSGDYERYFEEDGIRYHHILDTKTGYPADSGVNAVVVWSRDAALADALSTALFVMGAADGMAFREQGQFDFEALWYCTDGTVAITPGLAASYEHTAPQYLYTATTE